MRVSRLLFPVLAIAPLSCELLSPSDTLPSEFRVRGEAHGVVDGLEISCRLDLIYERNGSATDPVRGRVIQVEMGGGAERTVLNPDGSGLSLAPLLHSTTDQVHLLAGDSIEIVSPLNLRTEVPFYEGLGRLAGRLTGRGRGGGQWDCAPFQVREDSTGTVTGTWTLEFFPASSARAQRGRPAPGR